MGQYLNNEPTADERVHVVASCDVAAAIYGAIIDLLSADLVELADICAVVDDDDFERFAFHIVDNILRAYADIAACDHGPHAGTHRPSSLN
jgi:hypothetical protein